MSRKRNHRMQRVRAESDYAFAVMRDSQLVRPAEIARVISGCRLAFEKLQRGDGELADLWTLQSLLSIGLIRSEGIGNELVAKNGDEGYAVGAQLIADFQAGAQAMLECARLHKEHGRFGFTGSGLQAMKVALERYEEILGLSTPIQMAKAANEADRRVKAGHVITA